MKYCNQCKRLSAGQPLFCQFCNHTYDVKLCQHRHINSRSALFCQECGSSDLSTPQPERPLLLVAFLHVLPKVGALFLLLISVMVFFGVLQTIFSNQQLSGQLIALVLIIALLWFVYMKVADSFAGKAVRHLLRKGRSGGGQRHGH